MDAEHAARVARSALAGEVAPDDLDRVAVVRAAPVRRRSSLFFLGLAGEEGPHGPLVRWVIKQPHADSRQHDLVAPLTAEEQFAALSRLHAHLSAGDSGVRVPRPVAVVPEESAYLMEYVAGPTAMSRIAPAAVVRPEPLLEAVRSSAQVLRAVHALEPAVEDVVDLAELDRVARTVGPEALRGAGLPVRPEWFAPPARAEVAARGRKVVLHGDYAPENVVLSASGLVCLDADLADKDWAELDVMRFLVMLADAPVFVTGADLPPVAALRRRATRTFLEAYYGDEPWPASLLPLTRAHLATRWATRHTDVLARRPRLARGRLLLIRRHFTRLLDETCAPGWPAA